MPEIVAITGATGFIGRAIVRHLHEAGYPLRALVRSDASRRLLQGQVEEFIAGDLSDLGALEQLASGASAVVHCAGVVRGVTQADFDRVNVEGVRRLVTVLRQPGRPTRLLSLSSLAAREPQLSFYALSKRRGEQVLEQEGEGLQWLALRPPAVYGPGDRELVPLLRLMARGLAPVPGRREARFSMLYVEDLARLVHAWLRRDAVDSGLYSLHDGRAGGYSWAEVAAIVEGICGRRVRLLPLPATLLSLLARANRRLAPLLGRAPMLTPEKLRELRHPDWVCDNEAIGRVLDWSPRVGLEEGLRNTPGWR